MQKKYTTFFYLTLLGSLLFALYFHTFDNSFHLDDIPRIVANPHIRNIEPISRFFTDPYSSTNNFGILEYRPLLPLSLAIHYHFFKLWLPSYHIFNLCLLWGILISFFFISRRILPEKSKKMALFAVILMGIHPISSITVNYVVLRDLLLMVFFSSLSLLFFLRTQDKQSIFNYLGMSIFFILALLSKQNGILLPGIAFFYLLFYAPQSLKTVKGIRTLLPYAIIGLLFLYITSVIDVSFVGRDESSISMTNFYTVLKVHSMRYLPNIIAPIRMGAYPYFATETTLFNVASFMSLIGIFATIITSLLFRKRFPLIPFAVFTYWLCVLPSNSFIKLNHLAADYRPFWGLLFILVMLAAIIHHITPKKYLRIVIIVVLTYFTLLNIYHARFWQNDETLWVQSVKEGASILGYGSAAHAIKNKDPEQAIKWLEKAIEMAPTYATVHINLAGIYRKEGQTQKANAVMKRLLEIQPQSPETYYWLASHLFLINEPEGAYKAAKSILAFPVASPKELLVAAKIAMVNEHFDTALIALNRIHKKVPSFKDSHFMAANAAYRLKQFDKAQLHAEKSLDFDPKNIKSARALIQLIKRTKTE